MFMYHTQVPKQTNEYISPLQILCENPLTRYPNPLNIQQLTTSINNASQFIIRRIQFVWHLLRTHSASLSPSLLRHCRYYSQSSRSTLTQMRDMNAQIHGDAPILYRRQPESDYCHGICVSCVYVVSLISTNK